MKKVTIGILSVVAVVIGALAFVWFVNPFDVRDKILVNQIVKMRVAPKRLENPKAPIDYGMAYTDVDIMTADNVRLSAWEIPAPTRSNKTVIVNHPLTTTRYGSDAGLDNVAAEFLPMIKHLHDAGYNIVMYDHRGQGDSDGGIGSAAKGTEALVGAGVTEWQDVAASLRYVLAHADFADDEIIFEPVHGRECNIPCMAERTGAVRQPADQRPDREPADAVLQYDGPLHSRENRDRSCGSRAGRTA